MNEFSRILVAVDGSKTSERAVEKAITLAKLTGGRLKFLYVANITGVTGGPHAMNNLTLPEDVLASIKASGNASLDHMFKKVPAGLEVECFCETGFPSETILSFAEKRKMDLIVVGSRGLNAAAGMLLGSVSQFLAERAPMPVLIVK